MNDGQPLTPAGADFSVVMRLLFPVGFALALFVYGIEAVRQPHYRFVVLLAPAIVGLVPGRIRELGVITPGSVGGVWLYWGPATLLTACGIVFRQHEWCAIGTSIASLGAAYALGGLRLVNAVFPLWCCFWFAIRPPFGLDHQVMAWLQTVTADLFLLVLDALGEIHLVEGGRLLVPRKQFDLHALCRGVGGLLGAWAFTSVLCIYWHRSFRRWLGLMFVVPIWVISLTVLSAVATTKLWTAYGIAMGAYGQVLGEIVTTVAALLLIASTDLLFEWVKPYRSRAPEVTELRGAPVQLAPPKPTVWPNWRRTPAASKAAAVCGMGLIGLQLAFFFVPDNPQASHVAPVTEAPALGLLQFDGRRNTDHLRPNTFRHRRT